MRRYIACLAVTLLVGGHVRAGELDADFVARPSSASAPQTRTAIPARAATAPEAKADAAKGNEMDSESPADARRVGWGGGGWGWRGGWGGSWGGWRGGWGGWRGNWWGWRGGWWGWGG